MPIPGVSYVTDVRLSTIAEYPGQFFCQNDGHGKDQTSERQSLLLQNVAQCAIGSQYSV